MLIKIGVRNIFIAKITTNYLKMHFLLKSIDAIIIIKANTKKFSISKVSLIMTNAIQVKTMARNGINFFIGKYTKNHLRMCVAIFNSQFARSITITISMKK